MAAWRDFEREAPELAAAGRRLMVGADGVAIAFLATAGGAGSPHLSPACPIFCGDDLPKVRDLRASGRFALHAFLGESDEEFQVAGSASEVHAEAERGAVHEAIPFPAFERSDPVFRLDLERSLWVYWERVGQPDTKAIRQRWRATPR